MQDRVFHVLFGDRVHSTGRFIENNKARLPDEHLCESDPVPFPVRKFIREPGQDLRGFLFSKSCHPERDDGLSYCKFFGEFETD
jgi:hypothetical protein